MSCASGKETYPDLQTALVVRNEMIAVFAVPFLAYKCIGGCQKWHLTSGRLRGTRARKWNGIDTAEGQVKYWTMVRKAGWAGRMVERVKLEGEFLLW